MSRTSADNAAWWYLDRHLTQDTADVLCLITEGDQVTYRELYEQVCRTGQVLTRRGVGPGDRVVVVLPDCVTFVVAVLAAMRIGAVPVPISPMLTTEEHCYVIEDCGATAVVVDKPGGALADQVVSRFPQAVLWSRREGTQTIPSLPEQAATAEPLTQVTPRAVDDPALMQYTSGSTGRSKGVVHLHGGLLGLPPVLVKHFGITRSDRILSTAKLPFGYGFGNSLLMPFAVGASAVLFEGRSDPHNVSRLVKTFRPTLLFAVPTLYAALLALPDAQHRLDLSSVRLAVSAGEHLGAALGGRLTETLGLNMVNGLGSTECLHVFMATDPEDYQPGTTGQPLPGFEAEVLADDGQVLSDGAMGRLRVRGPGVAAGYWNRPELTAETFRDGWVYTGDIMRQDPEQGWQYLGRSDNVLNVGGVKIVTTEIEEEIQKIAGVRACAVVGLSDENELTRIIAYVVPEEGAAQELPERVMAGVRAALPPFKRPQKVRVVDELPTTSTGKTARFLIRERELERLP